MGNRQKFDCADKEDTAGVWGQTLYCDCTANQSVEASQMGGHPPETITAMCVKLTCERQKQQISEHIDHTISPSFDGVSVPQPVWTECLPVLMLHGVCVCVSVTNCTWGYDELKTQSRTTPSTWPAPTTTPIMHQNKKIISFLHILPPCFVYLYA